MCQDSYSFLRDVTTLISKSLSLPLALGEHSPDVAVLGGKVLIRQYIRNIIYSKQTSP